MSISLVCSCGKRYSLSEEYAGKTGRCRQCGAVLHVPAAVPVPSDGIGEDLSAACHGVEPPKSRDPRACGFCLSPLDADPAEPVVVCPACATFYHEECWRENGGCGVYGCAQAPKVEPRDPLEIPASYWGKDEKPCPACGATIQAMAIRCRHCGAVFASAQPQAAGEFEEHAALRKRMPELRRGTILLLVFSILTCTAPIAAIVGGAWYATHRRALGQVPGPYAALCAVALCVAIGQSVAIALMTALYGLTQLG